MTRQENRRRVRKLVLLAACANGHHPYLRTETQRVDGRYRTFCRACGRTALHTSQRRQALRAGQLRFLEPGEGGAETGASLGEGVVRQPDRASSIIWRGLVPRLVEVLGASAGSDVLEALRAWLSTHQPEELEKLIQERDLSSTFWSRRGD